MVITIPGNLFGKLFWRLYDGERRGASLAAIRFYRPAKTHLACHWQSQALARAPGWNIITFGKHL
jgi:hypothetical protein